jgi:O-antigen/teichoic acid export membrane protein
MGFVTVSTSQSDILLLTWLVGSEQVGLYRIAIQGAALVEISLTIVGVVLAPRISALYVRGRHKDLQTLITNGARAALVVALPIAIVFAAMGKEMLILVFGPEYSKAYPPLLILIGGQLFNVAAGSVGTVLNMTGHERDTTRGLMIAAVCSFILNLILIPPFGMIGAAIAAASGLVIWNLLLTWFVYRRTRLHCTAIGVVGI